MNESDIRAMEKYRKENIQQYLLKVNRKTEPDLYTWLEAIKEEMPLQAYLKELIVADMEKAMKGE